MFSTNAGKEKARNRRQKRKFRACVSSKFLIFIYNQIPQLQKLRLTFLCLENIILGYNFITKTLKEPVT